MPKRSKKVAASRSGRALPRGSGSARKATPAEAGQGSVTETVRVALAWLEQKSTQRDRDNLQRFGINASQAFGVSMANVQVLAKQLGKSHELATVLWETGWYEARLLTSFVDEPARVTPGQMDRWCRDFDNWAVCDTVCFHLFDRTPHAFAKVAKWSRGRDEFVKRAAFALLASLAGHDRSSDDAPFLEGLRLIEVAAADERNFVKKAVNWALVRIGGRNVALNGAALGVAQRLSEAPEAVARWVGKGALKELTKPALRRRFAEARAAAKPTKRPGK